MRVIVVISICALVLFGASCNRTNSGKPGETGGENPANPGTEAVDPLLESLNKKITENPNDFQAYLDRAHYYGDKAKYGNAFEDIARALAVDSTKAPIYLYKGELFFSQEKIKEAYEEFKNCIRFDGTNSDCLLKKSGIDIVLGNYDVAREQINTALKQNEYNALAYYMRGRLYKTLGDTSLAASSYKTAIEVDPDYYDAYVEVGLLYAGQKNELAKEYYNSAIDIRPRSIEVWYNKAMYLQETGYRRKDKYKEAFACYDTILKIDKNFVAADFNKGFIWLEYLQNYDSAAHYFSNAVQTFPGYFQAYYNRGLCYESLDKGKEAEADYRQALALNPRYDDAAKALDRLLRSEK